MRVSAHTNMHTHAHTHTFTHTHTHKHTHTHTHTHTQAHAHAHTHTDCCNTHYKPRLSHGLGEGFALGTDKNDGLIEDKQRRIFAPDDLRRSEGK